MYCLNCNAEEAWQLYSQNRPIVKKSRRRNVPKS